MVFLGLGLIPVNIDDAAAAQRRVRERGGGVRGVGAKRVDAHDGADDETDDEDGDGFPNPPRSNVTSEPTVVAMNPPQHPASGFQWPYAKQHDAFHASSDAEKGKLPKHGSDHLKS